jgi:hypothetical protein
MERKLGKKHCLLSQEVPGKMELSSAYMGSSGTNYSTVKSFYPLEVAKIMIEI